MIKANTPKKAPKPIPDLDPKLFWDVMYTKNSIKDYPVFVVQRVIERGSQVDFGKIINYYGKDKIKEYLMHNSQLNPKNKAFIKTFFKLTDQDLCSLRPSFPKLWIY